MLVSNYRSITFFVCTAVIFALLQFFGFCCVKVIVWPRVCCNRTTLAVTGDVAQMTILNCLNGKCSLHLQKSLSDASSACRMKLLRNTDIL